MELNKDLISQFVKNTKDDKKTTKKETFVRGMIVKNDKGVYCVKIDGSDIYTPATITTNVNVEQPVTIMIKNHSATVIGNVTTITEESTDSTILNSTSSMDISSISDSFIDALWEDYNS